MGNFEIFLNQKFFKDISVKVLSYQVVIKKKFTFLVKLYPKFKKKWPIFRDFYPTLADRLYRWIADYNRPIDRWVFCRLIGRLIGIGRTLPESNPRYLTYSKIGVRLFKSRRKRREKDDVTIAS